MSTIIVGGTYPNAMYPLGMYPPWMYPRFPKTPPIGWSGLDYPLTGDVEQFTRTIDIEIFTRTVLQDSQKILSVLTDSQTVRTGSCSQLLRTGTLYDINKSLTGNIETNDRTGEIYLQDTRTGDIDQ